MINGDIHTGAFPENPRCPSVSLGQYRLERLETFPQLACQSKIVSHMCFLAPSGCRETGNEGKGLKTVSLVFVAAEPCCPVSSVW